MAGTAQRCENDVKKDQIQVLSLAEGFFQSHVLFALLKLGVVDRLGHGEASLDQLASGLSLPPGHLGRVLNAGVVLKILQTVPGGRFRLAPAFEAVMLRDAGANYLGSWVRNLDYFAHALSRMDEGVRRGGPTVDPATHLGADPHHTEEFTLAMRDYAALRGKELAKYLDTRGCGTLLDLGCGPGTYAFHLGEANPSLHLHLLDLPGVLEHAREVAKQHRLRNQVTYLPVDVVREEIPGSYDLVLVSNTLHMLGEDTSRALIRRLHAHVRPGGSLVIQAQYLADDMQGPRWPIYLDLIQMCITSHGRNHSLGETRRWMEEAGFRRVTRCSMSIMNTNSFLRGWRD
jgi:SAM-dependent methyltransferase